MIITLLYFVGAILIALLLMSIGMWFVVGCLFGFVNPLCLLGKHKLGTPSFKTGLKYCDRCSFRARATMQEIKEHRSRFFF